MLRLMAVWAGTISLLYVIAGAVAAQQPPPRPFPQPNQRPAVPAPVPTKPGPTAPAATLPGQPTEATLGVPLYPTSQFIASYDAGRGQRFYLFGVSLPFAEMVAYYRTALKTRGDVLFETPPTHQFEIGRFRDETMAFPPTVTIKDYTFGGSGGYPNPVRGGQPERFPTVIQIVPAPPGASPNSDQ
jgi:hypothetical protein